MRTLRPFASTIVRVATVRIQDLNGDELQPSQYRCLVTAASFAAGLNLYATILTLGVLARFHWVDLPPSLNSLGHTWVLVACGVLFCAEFVTDKIPGLDFVWNALHTFVRIPVAALVAYHASSQLSPSMQIAATAIGAAVALAAHGSKIAVRAAVTSSPEPLSIIALSTTGDATAIGLTWVATTTRACRLRFSRTARRRHPGREISV